MADLIYIPHVNRRLGVESYRSAIETNNLKLVSINTNEAHQLPLSDATALALADHPKFMSKDALDIVLTRDRLWETGLPVLPSTPISKPEDAPEGSFVKTRNSGTNTEYVYQPHLGFPQEDLDITFAVNEQSWILPFLTLRLTHSDAKKPESARLATQEEVGLILPKLAEAVRKLNIKGGIHNVQFLLYENTWCVIDWNPRPPFALTEGLASQFPIMHRAVAFMCGQPLPEAIPMAYASKAYWETPIPTKFNTAIHKLGLFPRFRQGIVGIVRVNGIASTQEELDHKYQQLEQLIAQ